MEFSVAGRSVVVAGAARSGIAAAELLVRRGATVTVSESRESFPEAEALRRQGIGLELGGHGAATFAAADLVVLSPGVPPEQPVIARARARGVPVIGEIELAYRWLKGRVIAITGTKGKSTTTTLIGRMLDEAGFHTLVGGNIGSPISAQVEASRPDTLHVVEVSSFQLEQIETFRPWIAVMLNFSPDHLDRHPTVEAYGAAKARIFENQTASDWMVLNADDEPSQQLAEGTRGRRVCFSRHRPLKAGTSLDEGWIVSRSPDGGQRLVPLAAIKLLGPHLVDDVMAAATVARLAGATSEAMTAAVEGFHGLEHAMELVATKERVRFVNDSKATNVDAALRSIESFDRELVVVMGGHFKGGDLGLLREPLKTRAKGVVLIGESAPVFERALGDVATVRRAATLEEAVQTAFGLARPEGVVLLAPACASFDMFRDYAERGRRFKEAVRTLLQREASGL